MGLEGDAAGVPVARARGLAHGLVITLDLGQKFKVKPAAKAAEVVHRRDPRGRRLTADPIARLHDEDAGPEPCGLEGGRDASDAPSRDDHVVIPPADVLDGFGLRGAIEGGEARPKRQKEECR